MRTPHTQRGISLFISMLMLALLSALTTLLMANASLDLKMAGAAALKIDADQQLEGAIEELLAKNDSALQFASAIKGSQFTLTHISGVSSAVAQVQDQPSCARSRRPSSDGIFACRYLHTKLNRDYGRAKTGSGRLGNNSAGLGIEQKTLKN
ncbi:MULTISPECIES: hypothetical protein [unclassified Motilimonas]|uniref:hypothetical protein n=1 Tax=Motilimonas TaxID=1914248 RepID=UPI001E5C156F|nr:MULTISPECIES: hypothetical protein [unclassified Motilimonas]MCE0558658.1 hypothetical protein [Motilimonas sp. E26]MDO6525688.1 hypothetical protein [Motilimonas sp. 1_MG-2023]